jgi:hypothetical protein
MGRVGRLGGLTGPGSGCRATARRRDSRLRLRVQTAEHAIGRTRVALEVDAARSMTASTSGLGDRHQRCHPLRARVAAMAERDLSQHDQRPQSAFGQIVGRRNSRVVEKHEPLTLLPSAWLHALSGDWGMSVQRLNEAFALATRGGNPDAQWQGGMRLHLIDTLLQRVRLFGRQKDEG